MKASPITEPFSKAEILRDLEAVRDWSLDFWRQFETARVLRAPRRSMVAGGQRASRANTCRRMM